MTQELVETKGSQTNTVVWVTLSIILAFLMGAIIWHFISMLANSSPSRGEVERQVAYDNVLLGSYDPFTIRVILDTTESKINDLDQFDEFVKEGRLPRDEDDATYYGRILGNLLPQIGIGFDYLTEGVAQGKVEHSAVERLGELYKDHGIGRLAEADEEWIISSLNRLRLLSPPATATTTAVR